MKKKEKQRNARNARNLKLFCKRKIKCQAKFWQFCVQVEDVNKKGREGEERMEDMPKWQAKVAERLV